MISVCIPTYEQSGYGVHYLRQLLDSILVQRDAEFEVVVAITRATTRFGSYARNRRPGTHSLAVRYVRNLERLGVSNNTNNAIAHAASDRIKIMYQDDLLFIRWRCISCELALERKPWVVASYFSLDRQSRRGRRHDPFWHGEMLTEKHDRHAFGSLHSQESFHVRSETADAPDCEYTWLSISRMARLSLCACRSSGCYWEGSISESRDHARSRNTATCDRSI
jgi:hypothetical protein